MNKPAGLRGRRVGVSEWASFLEQTSRIGAFGDAEKTRGTHAYEVRVDMLEPHAQ